MSGRKSLSGAWFDLAWNSMALMQGSAFVIARRSAALVAAGANPSAAQKRDAQRMVEEKVSASAASWTRAAMASASAWQSLAIGSMLSGRPPASAEWQRASIKVLQAATAPYNSRVKANVKRLGRR